MRDIPVLPLEALTDGQLVDMLQIYEAFENGDGLSKGLPTRQFYPIRDHLAELVAEAYRRKLLKGVWSD